MRGNVPAGVTVLPPENSSNTPASTGSSALEHVFLGDEAHLEVELVELGLRSARKSSSRKHGAIWK